jgi:hypothetical protein
VITVLLLVASALAAEPGEVRLGFEVGVQEDQADRASGDYADFGVGPLLVVPLTIALTPGTRLRSMLRAEVGTGTDRVTWDAPVNGSSTALYADGHWAMAAVGSASLGLEVLLPIRSSVEVSFGLDTGIGWVGTYHSFSDRTRVLLDQTLNDLEDPNNVDPYTSQVVWRNSVDAAVAIPAGERLHLTLRAGYAVAFVDMRPLQKAPEALDAQRAAYGWNPLSATLGISRSW